MYRSLSFSSDHRRASERDRSRLSRRRGGAARLVGSAPTSHLACSCQYRHGLFWCRRTPRSRCVSSPRARTALPRPLTLPPHPAASTGVGSLATLLKRLEAACSRLEDVALTSASGAPLSNASAVGAAGVPPPAAAPSSSSAPAAVAAPQQDEVKLAPSVEAFQELVDGPLTKYTSLSKELGGLIEQQVRPSSLALLLSALARPQARELTHTLYRNSRSRSPTRSSPRRTLSSSRRRARSCRPRTPSTRRSSGRPRRPCSPSSTSRRRTARARRATSSRSSARASRRSDGSPLCVSLPPLLPPRLAPADPS